MSSDVNFDRKGAARAGTRNPDNAVRWDAGAALCREAAQRVSRWRATGARYLRERRMEDIVADLLALARERPGQTLAAAALLGALVGGAIHGLSRSR